MTTPSTPSANPNQLQFIAAILQARTLLTRPQATVAEVRAAFERAIAFSHNDYGAHAVLGDYLNQRGLPQDGIALLRPLFDAGKLAFEGSMALGNCCATLQDYAGARLAYTQAVGQKPGDPMARNNLGFVLTQLGVNDEALVHLSEAVIQKPDLMLAQSNLIDLLVRLDRWSDALLFCRTYDKLEKSDRSQFLLGRAYQETGDLAKARDVWTDGIRRFPQHASTATYLGGICYRTGDIARATALFRAAADADPNNAVATTNYLLALNYLPHDPRWIAGEHAERVRRWPGGDQPAPAKKPRLAAQTRQRRLRVGYLSPDFYEHPVGQIVAPVLKAHDAGRFEVFVYHVGHQQDGLTDGLRAHFGERWRHLPEDGTDTLVEKVKADSIDVLVDLCGHTGESRLPVFARRAAPVQVTYLGYPNTTGLSQMDYRITDAIFFNDTATTEIYTEQLLRMPAPFLCLRRPPELPDAGPTPALSNGHLTLASFNNLAKLSDQTLALWARVLQALPDARLLVKAAPLSDEALKAEQLARFAAAGIDTARVEMFARMGFHDHLALYRRVDLALDPFPYHGTATTIEALWMGIPVLALAGDTHVSRVSVSILTALGLPELVADSADAYVARCQAFAAEPQKLQQLRGGMRQRLEKSPATDPADSARKLEALYTSLQD